MNKNDRAVSCAPIATNFERITQSPEALAKAAICDEGTGCCAMCALNAPGVCSEESDCVTGMLMWLNAEAEAP